MINFRPPKSEKVLKALYGAFPMAYEGYFSDIVMFFPSLEAAKEHTRKVLENKNLKNSRFVGRICKEILHYDPEFLSALFYTLHCHDVEVYNQIFVRHSRAAAEEEWRRREQERDKALITYPFLANLLEFDEYMPETCTLTDDQLELLYLYLEPDDRIEQNYFRAVKRMIERRRKVVHP
jgi:hypothetical protein